MLMGLVNVERKDGVATLTLNNPSERNTMTAEMVADISAAMMTSKPIKKSVRLS